MKLFVTGGAGFIGSAYVRSTLTSNPDAEIVNFDALTYAGNLENLATVEDSSRYRFIRGNICNEREVGEVIANFSPDAIIHFAAESHVDRSILSPKPFVDTNFIGTCNLLEAAHKHGVGRFIQISTDEVYGSIDAPACADEAYPLRPSSPYSASKAGADLLALSYFTTYRLPVIVTRASNNYGPYQFPEKLIPLMISNALADRFLPIYGDGMQIRDWLHVEDHCRATNAVLKDGRPGEVYNVAGNRALANLEVINRILLATGKSEKLMRRVEDRPGHDRRYAVNSEKLISETGWAPQVDFEKGLAETIEWYKGNNEWVENIRSGVYQAYYERNYERREAEISRLIK